MTFSIPAVDQLGWGQPLQNHLAQLNDPETGGLNHVANVAERDSKFWANGVTDRDAFANKTVYVIATGTFHVWTISTDPANTRYWRELSKVITSQGWVDGIGTISSYGREIRGVGTSFSNINAGLGSQLFFPSLDPNTRDQVIEVKEVVNSTTIISETVPYSSIAWGGNNNSIHPEKFPSIQISNITGNIVTFNVNVSTFNLKPGDFLIPYTTSVNKYRGTVTAVNDTQATMLWETTGDYSIYWTLYRSINPGTNYKYQQALQAWSDGNKIVSRILPSGSIQTNDIVRVNTDYGLSQLIPSRNTGNYGHGLQILENDVAQANIFIVRQNNASNTLKRGDAVLTFGSSVDGGRFVIQASGNPIAINSRTSGYATPDLFIDNRKIGVMNQTPSEALHVTGNILATGTITPGSDIRWKENIVKIDSALFKISLLEGVTYDWKDKEVRGSDRQIGLIAQDVEKAFPEAVKKDNEGYMSVNYDGLVGALVEGIKELKAEIEELKKKIS